MSDRPDSERRDDAGSGFVRNDRSKRERDRYAITAAFANAAAGVAYALRTQRNMKIHVVVGIAAIALGIAFGIDAASWLAIVLCIVVVIAAECANTAIESVVDLVSPEYHELAKHAKDCAAAAVFVCAIGAVVVEAIILVPRILALVGLAAA